MDTIEGREVMSPGLLAMPISQTSQDRPLIGLFQVMLKPGLFLCWHGHKQNLAAGTVSLPMMNVVLKKIFRRSEGPRIYWLLAAVHRENKKKEHGLHSGGDVEAQSDNHHCQHLVVGRSKLGSRSEGKTPMPVCDSISAHCFDALCLLFLCLFHQNESF